MIENDATNLTTTENMEQHTRSIQHIEKHQERQGERYLPTTEETESEKQHN